MKNKLGKLIDLQNDEDLVKTYLNNKDKVKSSKDKDDKQVDLNSNSETSVNVSAEIPKIINNSENKEKQIEKDYKEDTPLLGTDFSVPLSLPKENNEEKNETQNTVEDQTIKVEENIQEEIEIVEETPHKFTFNEPIPETEEKTTVTEGGVTTKLSDIPKNVPTIDGSMTSSSEEDVLENKTEVIKEQNETKKDTEEKKKDTEEKKKTNESSKQESIKTNQNTKEEKVSEKETKIKDLFVDFSLKIVKKITNLKFNPTKVLTVSTILIFLLMILLVGISIFSQTSIIDVNNEKTPKILRDLIQIGTPDKNKTNKPNGLNIEKVDNFINSMKDKKPEKTEKTINQEQSVAEGRPINYYEISTSYDKELNSNSLYNQLKSDKNATIINLYIEADPYSVKPVSLNNKEYYPNALFACIAIKSNDPSIKKALDTKKEDIKIAIEAALYQKSLDNLKEDKGLLNPSRVVIERIVKSDNFEIQKVLSLN